MWRPWVDNCSRRPSRALPVFTQSNTWPINLFRVHLFRVHTAEEIRLKRRYWRTWVHCQNRTNFSTEKQTDSSDVQIGLKARYLPRRSDERTRAWHTSDRTCGQCGTWLPQSPCCSRSCSTHAWPWPSHRPARPILWYKVIFLTHYRGVGGRGRVLENEPTSLPLNYLSLW